MSEPADAARPSWVHRSDGRLVPFDPDRISLDLFAATEALGQPDAFLARELTDSILHFLAAETEGGVTTTRQVAELGAKVLRELGHPRLAAAFARPAETPAAPVDLPSPASSFGPSLAEVERLLRAVEAPGPLAAALGRRCLTEFSLMQVFARDLAAVHRDGLLTLGHLESPRTLAVGVLPLSPGQHPTRRLAQRVREMSAVVGGYLAVDSPEFLLSEAADSVQAVREFIRELHLGLAGAGLNVVVNLNCAVPPPEAAEPQGGPLFATTVRAIPTEQRWAVADRLLHELPAGGLDRNLRLDWHLTADDLQPQRAERLRAAAQRWVEGAAITFVFDRARKPIALAEGVDRKHSATLLAVGVHLHQLAQQPGLRGDLPRYVQKLGSLARLAVAAAVQKREFLRRHSQGRPALTQGFVLDRARLVVVPIGLEAAVRTLTERGLAGGGPGLEAASHLLAELRAALEREGRARYLEVCLDSAPAFAMSADADGRPEHTAGVTAWDVQATPRQQLKASAALPAASSAAILLDGLQPLSADEALHLLRAAWQQSDLTRLHLRQVRGVRQAAPVLWGQ
ncbi:MAG: hypothetical protein JNM56_26700 [Planctomycetia bacterium]|nr:hypothetical protein [Planctomycetia bacterium]